MQIGDIVFIKKITWRSRPTPPLAEFYEPVKCVIVEAIEDTFMVQPFEKMPLNNLKKVNYGMQGFAINRKKRREVLNKFNEGDRYYFTADDFITPLDMIKAKRCK